MLRIHSYKNYVFQNHFLVLKVCLIFNRKRSMFWKYKSTIVYRVYLYKVICLHIQLLIHKSLQMLSQNFRISFEFNIVFVAFPLTKYRFFFSEKNLYAILIPWLCSLCLIWQMILRKYRESRSIYQKNKKDSFYSFAIQSEITTFNNYLILYKSCLQILKNFKQVYQLSRMILTSRVLAIFSFQFWKMGYIIKSDNFIGVVCSQFSLHLLQNLFLSSSITSTIPSSIFLQ